MERDQQIIELVKAIKGMDEGKLSPLEKEFMKSLKAAERKMQAGEAQEALDKAGIDAKVHNLGVNMQIMCGSMGKEKEDRIFNILREQGWKCEPGEGSLRGTRRPRIIRIEYR